MREGGCSARACPAGTSHGPQPSTRTCLKWISSQRSSFFSKSGSETSVCQGKKGSGAGRGGAAVRYQWSEQAGGPFKMETPNSTQFEVAASHAIPSHADGARTECRPTGESRSRSARAEAGGSNACHRVHRPHAVQSCTLEAGLPTPTALRGLRLAAGLGPRVGGEAVLELLQQCVGEKGNSDRGLSLLCKAWEHSAVPGGQPSSPGSAQVGGHRRPRQRGALDRAGLGRGAQRAAARKLFWSGCSKAQKRSFALFQ